MNASIPPWVFGPLALILAVGLRQSRTKIVKPERLGMVAIAMLLLSLYGVTADFGWTAVALLSWGLGIGSAVTFESAFLPSRPLERHPDGVVLPGSWLPLGLMLGIFGIKFVLGFAHATAAPIAQEPWFAAAASALLGLCSGGFTARALAVRRCDMTLGTA